MERKNLTRREFLKSATLAGIMTIGVPEILIAQNRENSENYRTENSFTNSVNLKMIRAEPGDFSMGSTHRIANWDEQPVHKVVIGQPFYISETEIEDIIIAPQWKYAPYGTT